MGGAGDEEANGGYLRRYHHEGIVKELYSQAEWDRLNKQVGPWYEKRNGYFIFLAGARDSRYTFWKIRDNHGSSLYLCRPRKTEIVDVMGETVNGTPISRPPTTSSALNVQEKAKSLERCGERIYAPTAMALVDANGRWRMMALPVVPTRKARRRRCDWRTTTTRKAGFTELTFPPPHV